MPEENHDRETHRHEDHEHAHDHVHAHDHGHGLFHSHVLPGTSERRLALSLVLNLAISLAEVAGGLLSNSLALLSDAVHNLSDASSLGVSWLAKRISRMERTPAHSFGFKRAEILASLVNTVALVGIGVFLLVEAVRKFLHPSPVVGNVMLAVAGVGLLGNLFTAWLLHGGSKESLNIRSAYLHIVMDALSSVGVIVAALLMMAFGWVWLDPLLTLAVSLYVLRESWPLLKTSIHILMQGTPEGIRIESLIEEVESQPEVVDMHHVHLWTTDGTEVFLEAHVTLWEEARSRTDELLARFSGHLRDRFGIGHVTLQFEFSACVGGRCSGLDPCPKDSGLSSSSSLPAQP
ncbi:MAG: cation transporter [Synergistaceae bacterium]|nr:cation transporter [Synergistaceae bacterium]